MAPIQLFEVVPWMRHHFWRQLVNFFSICEGSFGQDPRAWQGCSRNAEEVQLISVDRRIYAWSCTINSLVPHLCLFLDPTCDVKVSWAEIRICVVAQDIRTQRWDWCWNSSKIQSHFLEVGESGCGGGSNFLIQYFLQFFLEAISSSKSFPWPSTSTTTTFASAFLRLSTLSKSFDILCLAFDFVLGNKGEGQE